MRTILRGAGIIAGHDAALTHPAELRAGGRPVRPHRPAEGGRAARRRGHRRAPGGARLRRGRGLARRIGLCRRRRAVLRRQHRRMPGHARRWWPTRCSASPAAAATTASRRTPSRWPSTTSSPSAPRRWWCRPTGPPAAATGSPTPSARRPWWPAGSRPATPAAWPGAAARRRRWPASSRPGASTWRPSCTGLVNPKERLSLGERLGPGDAIVLLASSGIHANGLSLARKLAERLPQGYLTEVAPGLGYGEALLAPTLLYSPVTEALWAAGIARALRRQHHRPRLAQAAAPPEGADLPHPHRAAGAAGAALHPAAGAARRRRGLRHAEHGRGLRALRRRRRRRAHGGGGARLRRGGLGGRAGRSRRRSGC